jgi:repressor LexA
MKLTQREQSTLDYIIDTIINKGYSPSVRDIKSAIGFKSTSTVYNCLRKLENEGYIQKEDGKSRTIRVDNISAWTGTKVPIIGKVTAGLPVLAEENYDGYVSFVADSIGCSQSNLFALKVSGVSMIEAGIMDGDVVIVDKRDYAENGEIVVAMIDDEATVKTFYRENGRYRLQPENHLLAPIYADEVSILGKVVACMRIY